MDIQFFCQEKGSGAPLILLHGNGEDSSFFSAQIKAFSTRCHVYALDTRGHGKTPRGIMPFTLRQFADDLRCFMDEKGLQKSNILGFSDGANIAMLFALAFPDRVDKLILNGGNAEPKGIKRSVQIPIEIGYFIARCLSRVDQKAQAKAEMLGLMVNEPHIQDDQLQKITAPTLVIAGTRDMVRQKHTAHIASQIPHAELVFIKGNHFIAQTNCTEFNKTIIRFLDV